MLVHCALGHGRSGTMLAAYLPAAGQASSVEEAVQLIQARRPKAGLHPGQLEALHRFQG